MQVHPLPHEFPHLLDLDESVSDDENDPMSVPIAPWDVDECGQFDIPEVKIFPAESEDDGSVGVVSAPVNWFDLERPQERRGPRPTTTASAPIHPMQSTRESTNRRYGGGAASTPAENSALREQTATLMNVSW